MSETGAIQGLDDVDPAGLPQEIDPTHPSIARVYDYVLGGKQHFAIDRQVSEALFRAVPEVAHLARDNRALLRRAVRWLVREAGITQIVDLGSGLPTEGNVHEVAHAVNPVTRVVYVDIDPIVLAHGRALLADDDRTVVLQADVTQPETIFEHPALQGLVDFRRPFAMIASGILHHLDDDRAHATVTAVRQRLSPGSFVLYSNFLDDDEPRAKELETAFLHGGLGTGRFRTWAEQREFFAGLEMVEPGLVYANDWKSDGDTPVDSPTHTLYAGGIGRMPA